jgi:STE24 endopeptidase
MNFIAIIILCTIGVDFILNLTADRLNLKHLRSELPRVFEGVYDPERYRKSQQYLRATTQFGWITSTFNLCLILVFWFAEGFPLLDKWVRTFELGPILSGLVYMGVLMLLKTALSLPFSVYALLCRCLLAYMRLLSLKRVSVLTKRPRRPM